MPTAIKLQTGAPITFKAAGGTALLSAGALANGAGRLSARADLGATPRASRYGWRARVSTASAPSTLGDSLRLYFVPSDGTLTDGALGAADAAVSAETLLSNCGGAYPVLADELSAAKEFIASGFVELADRYVSVAVWNGLGVTLDLCEITLTPLFDEVQTA